MRFWREIYKMNVLFTIVVTFFAGMGAGLGTGFAGMSAAAVISPMLITFLGMDPYMATPTIKTRIWTSRTASS